MRFAQENKKNLLFRAARTYESANEKESAEGIYKQIVELDPSDDIAQNALLQVRRALGKFDELVEMLLGRSERAVSRVEKARVLADIGRIYAFELEDKSQALVAYTQAFCEDPETDAYADEVERLAGGDAGAWTEATSLCTDASAGDMPTEQKMPLLLRLGRWYEGRAARWISLPMFSDPARNGSEPRRRARRSLLGLPEGPAVGRPLRGALAAREGGGQHDHRAEPSRRGGRRLREEAQR